MSDPVRVKQVELVYANLPQAILVGVIAIAFLTTMIGNHADPVLLTRWLLMFAVAIAYRCGLLIAYRLRPGHGDDIAIWDRLHRFGTLLVGIMWGFSTLFFTPDWPMQQQLALWMLLICLTAGASASFSVMLGDYFAFLLPVYGFSLVSLSELVDAGYGGVLILLTCFALFLTVTAVAFNRQQRALIGKEIQLAQANLELNALASRDPLTNLPNRRAFESYFGTEWSRHIRSASVLSLLMIDVDFFKQYNDRYGHQQGDVCLIRIANLLTDILHRPADMAVRYGGEEFLLMLPDTPTQGAVEVAERIRQRLEHLKIKHEDSSISPFVTVSIGVASCDPTPGTDPEYLLRLADQRMYQAKRSGRNQTYFQDDRGEETETIEVSSG